MESPFCKENSCNSKLKTKTEQCPFQWRVENFSLYPKPTVQLSGGMTSRFSHAWEYMASESFSSGESFNQAAKWKLVLCPYKFVGEKEYIGIYLRKIEGKHISRVEFQISVIDQSGKKSRTQKGNFQFRQNSFFGWDDFIPREQGTEDEVLFETLTIRCEMNIDYDIEIQRNSKQYRQLKPQPSTDPNLSRTAVFKELYEKKTFSDVVLQVEDEKFHVHKAILSAHSPVFESMFQHNMKEKLCDTVKIVDTTASVLELMIQYIYCGDIFATNQSVSFEVLLGLYECADKYNVAGLAQKCSEYLFKRLNEEYVCEIIIAAFLHNDQKLVESAKNFIINNSFKVMTSTKWAQLLHQYPDLVQQIVEQEKQTVIPIAGFKFVHVHP